MVYLLRSAFRRLESPHHIAAWWGRSQEDEAFSPSPSMLTPYSPRHASTTIWRGVWGGGKGGGGFDPVIRSRVSGSGRLFLLLFLIFFTLHSSVTTWEGQTPTPTCCSSSLTKGTISEPHWLECRIADFFFSSQAANWYVSHENSPSQLKGRWESVKKKNEKAAGEGWKEGKGVGKAKSFGSRWKKFSVGVASFLLNRLLSVFVFFFFPCARTFYCRNRSHSTRKDMPQP